VTNAVVASAVVLLPAVCVTAVVPVGREGVPVKVGLARGAKPEMDAPAGMVTVPVKVGEAIGAYVVAASAVVSRPRAEKVLFFQRSVEDS
jgi:hypothetical protein